jgi:hypothetical protein
MRCVKEKIRALGRRLGGLHAGLDKKLVKLARWLGTKVLRLDSFNF